jgi:putative transposase
VRYSFIREHRRQFRVAALCRVLRVSASGFFAWLRRPESPRQQVNRELVTQLKAAYESSRKTYGRRRVHAKLLADGVRCSPNRVARLMRAEGLQGLRKGKFKTTTDSTHSFPVAENLLARNFTAAAPNRVWVSDITYLACEEGWEYLATVMDLGTRRIVGWAMQSSLERSLTLKALDMAITQRRPAPGLIHHSDRGVQYACGDYQTALKEHRMVPSMSRKGDCWDNAPKESFFSTLKSELGLHRLRPSREEVHRKVFEYIEVFYNRQRLHSSLRYLSPAEYERRSTAKAA